MRKAVLGIFIMSALTVMQNPIMANADEERPIDSIHSIETWEEDADLAEIESLAHSEFDVYDAEERDHRDRRDRRDDRDHRDDRDDRDHRDDRDDRDDWDEWDRDRRGEVARCVAIKSYFGFRAQRFTAFARGRNYAHARRKACRRALRQCERSAPYVVGSCTVR